MERAAVFPEPGFRRSLYRQWSERAQLIFIGLNPGKADGTIDDATARKMVGFATRWGAGAYWAFNLFEYVSTDPLGLVNRLEAGLPCNSGFVDGALLDLLRGPHTPPVCFAWGNPPCRASKHPKAFAAWKQRTQDVMALVDNRVLWPPWVAAQTKDGNPAHLSRLPYVDKPTLVAFRMILGERRLVEDPANKALHTTGAP
ncbi:MAG: DUF1643 domain-containing protein [Terriglobales bacterium]